MCSHFLRLLLEIGVKWSICIGFSMRKNRVLILLATENAFFRRNFRFFLAFSKGLVRNWRNLVKLYRILTRKKRIER